MYATNGDISELLQRSNFKDAAKIQMLAPLSTCRALREETLPIFFSVNSFVIRGRDAGEISQGMQELKRTIGSKNCGALRSMVLDIGDLSLATFEKACLSFDQLQKFLAWVAELRRNGGWRHCGFKAIATFVLRFHPSWRTIFKLDLDFEDIEASWEENIRRTKETFGEDLGYWNKIRPMLDTSRENLRLAMRGDVTR